MNTRLGKLIVGSLALFVYWCLGVGISPIFAQDSDKVVSLSKQIMDVKSSEDTLAAFEDLTDLYFKENKYNEFVDYLNSLLKQKKALEPQVNYYTGLTRYYQLKHLEEAQNWDEYFAQGNSYRQQLTTSLEKAVNLLKPDDLLSLYSKLILWKFHKDQNDTSTESSLTNLMDSALGLAKASKNTLPIKDIAKELLSYGERGKARELYRIYVDKLVTSQIKDEELNKIAKGFYDEANLDLAEAVYDVYIDRLQKSIEKEKIIPLLIEVANMFAYKDQGASDTFYAEKIFKRIEDIGGKDSFSEELLYLRAFNYEKAKDYKEAKDSYNSLVQKYPAALHADAAIYKVGIITTYVLRDINTGKGYFGKLSEKETLTNQGISSLYQLGLLSQWVGDLPKAKEYYNKLLEKAGGNFQETVRMAKERLKEIEEEKPIEYNLKTFLDVSLKEGFPLLDTAKLDLKSNPYTAKVNSEVKITSNPPVVESGCMQVELEYLWSGDIGKTNPSASGSSLNTTYTEAGTKEINLVVVSPSGVLDRNIDIVDVH